MAHLSPFPSPVRCLFADVRRRCWLGRHLPLRLRRRRNENDRFPRPWTTDPSPLPFFFIYLFWEDVVGSLSLSLGRTVPSPSPCCCCWSLGDLFCSNVRINEEKREFFAPWKILPADRDFSPMNSDVSCRASRTFLPASLSFNTLEKRRRPSPLSSPSRSYWENFNFTSLTFN